jgi:transposase-like protein
MSPAVPLEAVPGSSRKAHRRRFTDEYKLRILEEIDACTEPGQISALLRREKLYSSYLVEWRQMRARGELGSRPPAIRSTQTPEPLSGRLVEMEQENRQLQERLRQAELILDIQEKTLKLFGVNLKPRTGEDDDPRSRRAEA